MCIRDSPEEELDRVGAPLPEGEAEEVPVADGEAVPEGTEVLVPEVERDALLEGVAEEEPELLLEELLEPEADPLSVKDAVALALSVAAEDAAVDGEVVPLPVADCVAVLDGVAEREPEPLLEELLELVADPLSV